MNNLKLNRVLRGLSQEELASACGLTQSTYSRIERELRQPKPREVRAISDALGLSPSILFGRDGGVDDSEASS